MTARPRHIGWLLLGAAGLLGLVLAALVAFTQDAAASRPHRLEIVPGSAGPVLPTGGPRLVPRRGWISTWGAAPQGPVANNDSERGFADQTIRQIVYTSVGGTHARIELSNAFGSAPMVVGAAAIGIAGRGAAVLPGSERILSFGHQTWVSIPPGAEAVSDPVALAVRPLQRLAVSLYLPAATGPVTEHADAEQTSYIGGGDRIAQTRAAGLGTTTRSWYLLDGVDVLAPARDVGAIVALGDSITDGVNSGLNANARWPNDLARRIDARPGAVLSVIDEGIGGNRVLNNATCCGTNAVARFQRDVAGRAGAREVILLEGVNDIGFALHTDALSGPNATVSAAQIIAGDKLIIAEAHADSLKIFGATITPFQGARYWSPAGEANREAVNTWIRTSGAFDGVIDFAGVLADPSDLERLNPIYDSGDRLHPNALGYRAMADAINLSALVSGL
ncbi:MAG TPA: SGNH/GDSL hydrolase family protein [Solirubrobacteraceae bacterium]|jgi:lysophospholipase L1-like esterase|nr:SGNH/GDSL hydrolase family protein [Solirubrobacteraceae bacterium]